MQSMGCDACMCLGVRLANALATSQAPVAVITARRPKDWQGLQRDVALILDECGFSVEVEKTVQLARGQANIDVHAV